MKRSTIFLILFLAVSLGDILSIALEIPLHYGFKPAIMLMLIAYYISQSNESKGIFLAALFFCWLGDVLLMFQGEIYFILGLVAFLIGHLFYIVTFRQLKWTTGKTLLPTQKVRFPLPIVLATIGLMVVLQPKLGAMLIPVLVYAIVIMIMAISALFRNGFTNPSSFGWVFAGAIFFMISDSTLAINKFHTQFIGASIIIMSTYVTAQFMIVRGVLNHSPSN